MCLYIYCISSTIGCEENQGKPENLHRSIGKRQFYGFVSSFEPGTGNMRIRSCVRAQLKKIEVEAAVEVGGDADGEVEAGGDEGEIPGRAA